MTLFVIEAVASLVLAVELGFPATVEPLGSLLAAADAWGSLLVGVEQVGSPSAGHDAAGSLLQAEDGVDVSVNVTNVAGSAVGAFLTTLVVGAIMVAVAPEYTERTMAQILDDAVGSFVYGLVCLVFVVLVTLVLVFTIVGILVAIPFAVLAYLVWAVGSAIAFLAIGDRLVGREDGWPKPLLVGAAINGVLTLTGIGGIVSFAVGAAGFGAVLRDWLE